MAELIGAFGVPHTPMLWKLLSGEDVPADLAPIATSFARVRQSIAQAKPDAFVIIASDHFHEFNHANMAAFSIGKSDWISGTHRNEERSFGLPTVEMPGHSGLAESILGRETLAGGFDFSFSNNPRLDHAYVVPLLYLHPEMDIPVVPIHTNTNAPPLPSARRFIELGEHLAEAITGHPEPLRVIALATGHLAYELGGPNQFLGRSTDPDFDEMAVGWIRSGNLDEAAELCSFDRLAEAGNLTFQFLNFLTLAALVGRPAKETQLIDCRFGNEPFFSWEPS